MYTLKKNKNGLKKTILASLTQNACGVSRFKVITWKDRDLRNLQESLGEKNFLRTSYRDNFDVHKT